MARRFISMFWLIGFLTILYYISGPIKGVMDSIDSLALPLTSKVIVLDPGHGGWMGEQLERIKHLKRKLL